MQQLKKKLWNPFMTPLTKSTEKLVYICRERKPHEYNMSEVDEYIGKPGHIF